MSLKVLQKLEREILKTEENIIFYKEKVKALKQRKVDEENTQIIRLVRAANISPIQLQEILLPVRQENIVMEEESNV